MLNLLGRIALLCITDFPRLSSTSLLQSSSQLLLTFACFCLVCGYQSYIHGILIQARFHINWQLQCMVSECNTYQRPCGIQDLRLEQFTNTPISKYLFTSLILVKGQPLQWHIVENEWIYVLMIYITPLL